MLDPNVAGKAWQEHFDTVTPEEFVANMKRANPDFAREIWGGIARSRRSAANNGVRHPARAECSRPSAGLS